MPQDNRGNPPPKGGKAGGDRRDGRPGGNKRGGPRRDGPGGRPAEHTRAETYETVKEVTRGADFKIDKSVVADKATHRPVRTEYRLTRQGLDGTQVFSRLADAITASTAPLPEPEPEIAAIESEADAAELPVEAVEPEPSSHLDDSKAGDGEH